MNKVKRRVIYVDAGQNENKEFPATTTIAFCG